MKLPDVNVLLYASNPDSDPHEAARSWLEGAFASDRIGIAWLAVIGFVRIATSPSVFPDPFSVQEAMDSVDDLLDHPSASVLSPTARHRAVLRSLLERTGTAGNLTSDAHLAALAIEHGATLASFDADFHRFQRDGLAFEYLG